MKKTLVNASLLGLLLTLNLAPTLAQTQPSAPDVVAPAQPAGQQNVTSGLTTTSTTAVAPAAAANQPSMLGMAAPFLIMLGIMYFLMIRPQQKRMKDHQTLITGLKGGDEVITTSGIFGTVSSMDDKVVTLEVSKNVNIKVLKAQVNQVVKA